MICIETPRLLLRTWTTQDLDPYWKLNQDSRVLEFLPGPLSKDEVAVFIDKMEKSFSANRYMLWAVEEKHSGELMGFVGLSSPAWEAAFTPCVEIGWRLGSAYWEKGYATEGALAVLTYGFDELGLTEIVSFTVPENVRSRRVMEKIGMTREFKGDFSHPKLPLDHRLSKHVLYRLSREKMPHNIDLKVQE